MKTHTLSLKPTDVLFFKDGRPMEGSSSGHGAAWPLPHVIDAAIHAALHRAKLDVDLHKHVVKIREQEQDFKDPNARHKLFGSLKIVGPFPLCPQEQCPQKQWLFPRPGDAEEKQSSSTTHRPLEGKLGDAKSSLHPALLPVVNTKAPSKDTAEKWLNKEAFEAYLNETKDVSDKCYFKDSDIFEAEHNVGIGIDPTTGTQDGERIYSASYLRLKNDWEMGIIANCIDRSAGDLIQQTFLNSGHANHIIAGGQQRVCTVYRQTPLELPLPQGPKIEGCYVRWTLLTPAIFPHIEVPDRPDETLHPGGWLPTWICPERLAVQLKDPSSSERHDQEARHIWRNRIKTLTAIDAKLVAAKIANPNPVTGWSLGYQETSKFGAKSTHLAVPAGSVYYFKADDPEEAKKLATALNWHGSSAGTEIQNRRSGILGEKGYGIGVCSAWKAHQ